MLTPFLPAVQAGVLLQIVDGYLLARPKAGQEASDVHPMCRKGAAVCFVTVFFLPKISKFCQKLVKERKTWYNKHKYIQREVDYA